MEFYKKIQQEMKVKRAWKLAFLKKLSIVYIPGLALAFAILYWIIGLKQAKAIWTQIKFKKKLSYKLFY